MRFHHWVHQGSEWFHHWDQHMDRLEEFASNFGAGYARRVDGPLLAMGTGICALIVLTLGALSM
jgi:hypothetical protein